MMSAFITATAEGIRSVAFIPINQGRPVQEAERNADSAGRISPLTSQLCPNEKTQIYIPRLHTWEINMQRSNCIVSGTLGVIHLQGFPKRQIPPRNFCSKIQAI